MLIGTFRPPTTREYNGTQMILGQGFGVVSFVVVLLLGFVRTTNNSGIESTANVNRILTIAAHQAHFAGIELIAPRILMDHA